MSPLLTVSFVLVLVFYIVSILSSHPLRRVPGPWWTRWTRLWEWRQIRADHFEQVNIDLHRKYGPVVRISPNRYSISSPEVVQQIYGHGSKFYKDKWYRAYGHPDDDHADLFSVMNEKRHAANRRKIAALYSMTGLLSYESIVDTCNALLVARLDEFSARGESISIPTWMQYYAFDVIGEITAGESFGMIRRGDDPDGILQTIHQNLAYSSRMSLFCEFHAWLGRLNHLLGKRSPFENINAYVLRRLAAHRDNKDHTLARPDFIQHMLDLQQAGKLEEADLFNTVNANIAAGSDTTGLTLSAVIYYLAQTPEALRKLREEVDAQPDGPIPFSQTQNMVYLQAVIKEGLRLHPAVGMPLPRVVPPEGTRLAGYFFPGGTVVGANAWVVHRDPEVFGKDCDIFRPERWLGSKEEVAPLERNLFAFGAGSRTCIGKNLSLLEMTKLLPQLYRHFDFELEGPWETVNVFFVKQKFTCKIRRR